MSAYPTEEQKKLLRQVITVQEFIAAQQLADGPCLLLVSQLSHLEVFADKLTRLACQLRSTIPLPLGRDAQP